MRPNKQSCHAVRCMLILALAVLAALALLVHLPETALSSRRACEVVLAFSACFLHQRLFPSFGRMSGLTFTSPGCFHQTWIQA